MIADKHSKIKIVLIVGPTSVGKSGLAMELAREFEAEIVNADSMQVYHYMDIGTAKPTLEDRRSVTHHLIDVVKPDEDFNAAIFSKTAGEVIKHLNCKNKNILIVGGTGLYIKALLNGILESPGTDTDVRKAYRHYIEKYGKNYLWNLLNNKDSESARRIHPNNIVRIIRALEVYDKTGISLIKYQQEHNFSESMYDFIEIGLNIDRDLLYQRIERRTDWMIEEGLVEEVQNLLEMGYDETLKPMQSMSYRHIPAYLYGKISLEDTVRRIKRDTRNYAKRQMTWFKKDLGIEWCCPKSIDNIKQKVEHFLVSQEKK